MGLSRSTYYDEPAGQSIEEARLIERVKEICAEWPCYGYRRVTAQLHAESILVNHKKVMRLMREHGLTVRPRRRFVATTDSDHDGPIFPNRAKDVAPTGPNQLWVSDITYIALPGRFIYVAIILDAWSHLIVCYRAEHRRPPDGRGIEGGCRAKGAAAGLHSSLRSRLAIRRRGVPQGIADRETDRLNGTTRQSL